MNFTLVFTPQSGSTFMPKTFVWTSFTFKKIINVGFFYDCLMLLYMLGNKCFIYLKLDWNTLDYSFQVMIILWIVFGNFW
jgi:hypothetical protein